MSAAAIDGFANHARDRGADEDRLIGQRHHAQIGRSDARHARQQLANALDDIERGSVSTLQDGDENAATAVLTHDVGLHLKTVADAGEIAQINGGPGRLLNGQTRDLIDGARRAVGADVVLALADLDGAGRHHDILQGDGVQNIARRDALRLHRVLIHVDGDLALFAAVRRGHHRARNRDQLRAHRVGGDVVQLPAPKGYFRTGRFGESARDGRAEVDDLRRKGSRGKLPQHELRSGGDLRVGRVETGARLEEDLDHRHAVVGGGFNMLNVVDQRRDRLFVGRGETPFQFLRIEAGVGPAD